MPDETVFQKKDSFLIESGLGEVVREATKAEISSLQDDMGDKSIEFLKEKGLEIFIEKDLQNTESRIYIIALLGRAVTIVHTPNLRLIDLSFEMVPDYIKRKKGVFVNDESFARNNDVLQQGTIDFMRQMGEFVSKIDDSCRVRLVAEERRMKIYKRFVDQLGKKNVLLAPKSFSITLDDL